MNERNEIARLKAEVRELWEQIRKLTTVGLPPNRPQVRLARKAGSPTGGLQQVVFLTAQEADRQSSPVHQATIVTEPNVLVFQHEGQFFICECGESSGDCSNCSGGSMPSPIQITITGVADGDAQAGTAALINGTHSLSSAPWTGDCGVAIEITDTINGGNIVLWLEALTTAKWSLSSYNDALAFDSTIVQSNGGETLVSGKLDCDAKYSAGNWQVTSTGTLDNPDWSSANIVVHSNL